APRHAATRQRAVRLAQERRVGGWNDDAAHGSPPRPLADGDVGALGPAPPFAQPRQARGYERPGVRPRHGARRLGPAPPAGAPGAASARPTSRPRSRTVTTAAGVPGVPPTDTATAPSSALAAAIPRLGAASSVGAANATTRTPRGMAAIPSASALRCRSLAT